MTQETDPYTNVNLVTPSPQKCNTTNKVTKMKYQSIVVKQNQTFEKGTPKHAKPTHRDIQLSDRTPEPNPEAAKRLQPRKFQEENKKLKKI